MAFKRIRLPNFHYGTPGPYFVTICTRLRICYFGEIINDEMHLSEIGNLVKSIWEEGSGIWTNVHFDAYCIMPNHLHAIIWFTDDGVAVPPSYTRLPWTPGYVRTFGSPSKDVSSLIRGFKSAATSHIHKAGFTDFGWQSRFNDRIIRDQTELEHKRQYIFTNPQRWNDDDMHPDAPPSEW
ncbi:MAG: hypothetical protein EAZ89_00605 [Bacteroidetes bacterium]|nr:MAG: hypothetical protein EAZ89_00605 [Bacteroidota bacterium]